LRRCRSWLVWLIINFRRRKLPALDGSYSHIDIALMPGSLSHDLIQREILAYGSPLSLGKLLGSQILRLRRTRSVPLYQRSSCPRRGLGRELGRSGLGLAQGNLGVGLGGCLELFAQLEGADV